jgi:hypothetical protein
MDNNLSSVIPTAGLGSHPALAAVPTAALRARMSVSGARPLSTGVGRYGVRASDWPAAMVNGHPCALITQQTTTFDIDVDPKFSIRSGPSTCSPPA